MTRDVLCLNPLRPAHQARLEELYRVHGPDAASDPALAGRIEAIVTSIDAAPAVVISSKEMLQSVLDLLRDLAQMHVNAATSGAFDLEVRSIEEVESLE